MYVVDVNDRVLVLVKMVRDIQHAIDNVKNVTTSHIDPRIIIIIKAAPVPRQGMSPLSNSN